MRLTNAVIKRINVVLAAKRKQMFPNMHLTDVKQGCIPRVDIGTVSFCPSAVYCPPEIQLMVRLFDSQITSHAQLESWLFKSEFDFFTSVPIIGYEVHVTLRGLEWSYSEGIDNASEFLHVFTATLSQISFTKETCFVTTGVGKNIILPKK